MVLTGTWIWNLGETNERGLAAGAVWYGCGGCRPFWSQIVLGSAARWLHRRRQGVRRLSHYHSRRGGVGVVWLGMTLQIQCRSLICLCCGTLCLISSKKHLCCPSWVSWSSPSLSASGRRAWALMGQPKSLPGSGLIHGPG